MSSTMMFSPEAQQMLEPCTRAKNHPSFFKNKDLDSRYFVTATYNRLGQMKIKHVNSFLRSFYNLYTMEFYAAMKKNEMLSFAGNWMELENIILSEVSLAQKTKNCMFSLICGH
jgi:hypothetical protein